MIRVRAINMCYYDNRRYREGQEFFIKSEKEFSKLGMEYVDKKPSKKAEASEEESEPKAKAKKAKVAPKEDAEAPSVEEVI